MCVYAIYVYRDTQGIAQQIETLRKKAQVAQKVEFDHWIDHLAPDAIYQIRTDSNGVVVHIERIEP